VRKDVGGKGREYMVYQCIALEDESRDGEHSKGRSAVRY